MRMIIAIIQPTKLAAVRDALQAVGVDGMTVCDAQGYGRQRGQSATFRGVEYRVELLRKLALEIMVTENLLEPTLQVLRSAALTGSEGHIGDGKIFVLPVTTTIDISSDVHGPEAV